ncbi:MAG TPA: SDR family NAD(P)-dependent oxidoreductase [Terracidiphilus sp.]|nr:SDR family NAD(P)-dependent oxidoreductase [Terracidiphilus sp.]
MKPSAVLAIVGMAGRFPGAPNIADFWRNIRDGVESVRQLSDAELLAAGATPEELADPCYVKAASRLDDVPMFDAGFFGLSPRDASIMDPQHRHFLECAWEALEDAGHPPRDFNGTIGVFAGSGMNTYLIHNLLANRRLLETAGLFQLKQTGNDKDVLATRVSYQLDLRGPSINVQTACSTSLVAVHLACQSLLNYECDMALAGGVTIEIPHGRGYLYREGEILSRDGHCRPFDSASSGTIFGSGAGIVVLRRLDDALLDHDHVRALILGSALNNDGARKVGYLAPSVEGQAEVIAEALDFAGVSADQIDYIEAHGTGTIVGDPIEVRALTQAFRRSTPRSGYCGIGSLKSNIGHLDAAAGVSGVIKTVLALEHAQLPPSINCLNLNPHIELKDSPFYINRTLTDWPTHGSPRRAGVTALGVGGTNAHVVLEEAPRADLLRQTKPYQVLTVSAKTEAAAEQSLSNLVAHVQAHSTLHLADVAFTCQVGRYSFSHRRALIVSDSREELGPLADDEHLHVISGVAAKAAPKAVFMFSGQGSQYVGMGRELYAHEPVFRDAVDLCAQHLLAPLGLDLRTVLYPPEEDRHAASERLNETWLTQPALFVLEYALAHWWMSLGVEPAAMVGHSIGEYVAACLAGVFSLEDALTIVAYRGRLIYDLPSGSMLAVPLQAAELHLNGELSLAAVNNPEMCVVSGPPDAIAEFEQTLAAQSVACRHLYTSHAFHSAMMNPILESFTKRVSTIAMRPPRIPYLSNVSGTWIQADEATNPAYWAKHIRQTVQFSTCLATLGQQPGQVVIEVGPGNTLTSLARGQIGNTAKVFQSLPHPREKVSDLRCAFQTLAQLWVSGVDIDWVKLHTPGSVQRISLPTYPFEHRKYWIEPDRVQSAPVPVAESTARPDQEKGLRFYRRSWKHAPAGSASISRTGPWMVFADSLGLGDRIAAKLRATKRDVILVAAGRSYKQSGRFGYTIRPGVRADYDTLIGALVKRGLSPKNILHLWSATAPETTPALAESLDRSFYSPLYLAQELTHHDIVEASLTMVSNRMQQVHDESVRNPASAVVLGLVRVIPQELPGLICWSMDVDLETDTIEKTAAQIVAEITIVSNETVVAFRGSERFAEVLESIDLDAAPERPRLRNRGVYLITGGLGGIGLAVAEHLAREFNARLVLLARSAIPTEAKWKDVLNDSHTAEAEKQRLRQLIRIGSLAGGLLVAQADVTNLSQMRDVIAQARKQFGRLDGVFHAAGMLDDGPLLLKTAEGAARVLDPKVRGTLVLEEALGDATLDCFVLFSSISSIQAPAGQVDYAAANAFLDAFALSRKGPLTVINWGAWNEVGMGTRSAATHPWLEQRLLDTSREQVYESQFSTDRQWLISDHKLKTGKALIPGTGYLEMAAGAFARGTFRSPFQFENVFFVAPLTFESSESKTVRIQLRLENETKGRKGAFRFSVFARPGSGEPGEWIEHATGLIAACSAGLATHIDRVAIGARCNEREIAFDERHRTKQETYFDFGPRWRCLNRLRMGKGEGFAELTLDPQFAADCSTFLMHPALLDLATGCSLYLTDGYESAADLHLPLSYKKICVYHSFPSHLFSYSRARETNALHGEVETFDITLFDEHDVLMAEIEGFAMRRIGDAVEAADGQPLRQVGVSGGEQPIEISERGGIPTSDAVRALCRILRVVTPSAVVVVPGPLRELSSFATHQAPPTRAVTLDVAEGSEGIPETLAAWWQDLLGVEHVALDDDFFELGGHSLVGVRLFAKIKKKYQVDLELSVLFEARTLRRLAEVIARRNEGPSAESRIWSSLVPIQPSGSRIPLFCVHAVGGDVLFYQPLSNALGSDQPFYAFQSPLVAEEIHEISLEELASIYVKELRAFYPNGPYLLLGASLGGHIAFEMARQLRAQGMEPRLLMLIDAGVPGSDQRLKTVSKIHAFVRNMRKERMTYLMRKAREKTEYWRDLWLRRLRFTECAGYKFVGRSVPLRLHYFQAEQAHLRALQRYSFQPYAGQIILFRATDRGEILGRHEHPTLGWGDYAAGGLEIYDIPSAHVSMLFEPYVRTFADKLKTILPS